MRMPTMMNGVEAGTTTLTKIVRSDAPSTRAALMRVLSTSSTPWKVETTLDRNAARKITNTLGVSPMPISRMASGMIARGGIVLKNWTYGSIRARAVAYQPMRKPIGIARTVPSANPMKTRRRLARTSLVRVPSVTSSAPRPITSTGPGRLWTPRRDSAVQMPSPAITAVTLSTAVRLGRCLGGMRGGLVMVVAVMGAGRSWWGGPLGG
ncbi:hypothetical protein GCM10020001_063720 [Nonomuraea salmonea]